MDITDVAATHPAGDSLTDITSVEELTRQQSITTKLRRKSKNLMFVITTLFFLITIVGTAIGVIDSETLETLTPLILQLVDVDKTRVYNGTVRLP